MPGYHHRGRCSDADPLASVPERPEDPHLSLRDPHDLWNVVLEHAGTLQMVIVQPSGGELVFEFDVHGADPDFV